MRYRLSNPLEEANSLFRFLVRSFYQLNFAHPTNGANPTIPWLGLNLVGSFGRVSSQYITVDLGGYGEPVLSGQRILMQTLGAGYTRVLNKEVSIGLEYFHEHAYGTTQNGAKNAYAGPNLAYKRGAIWASAGGLLGITETSARLMPRVLVGMAF